MKFFETANRLAKEVFSLKRYAKMPKALAVFVGIFLAPFFVGFIFALGALFIASILFAIMQAPLDYLHRVLREEGDRVKTATQVVVYFFSWPFVFFLYIWYALLTLFIYIAYFVSVCFGYIISLGGIFFHVDPFYEKIGKEVEREPNYKIYIPVIHVAVCATLLLALGISAIVYAVTDDFEIYENGSSVNPEFYIN